MQQAGSVGFLKFRGFVNLKVCLALLKWLLLGQGALVFYKIADYKIRPVKRDDRSKSYKEGILWQLR